MRLLCINNSGAVDLELMKEYNAIGEGCPSCKKVWYLEEIDRPPYNRVNPSPIFRCLTCGNIYDKTESNNRPGFFKHRFIELDNLHEIEEQEYSEQLENV